MEEMSHKHKVEESNLKIRLFMSCCISTMLSAIIDFLYLHQGSLYPQLIEKSGKFAEGV